MIRELRSYFYAKAVNSNRVHAIYILPTLDGLKVLGLNFILLVIGLVYANNYVLLFNFILFCLFLASMFYTHFNLSGISLSAIQIPALHANENGKLSLHFKTTNSQGHHFVRVYFKSHLLKMSDSKKTYNIPFDSRESIEVPIMAVKRGQETLPAIYVETLFPFNFFRCFTYFKVNQDTIIYPARIDTKLHEELELFESSTEDGDDFYIRNYQIGDSLKRIDWKKLAQTNQWYTRQFQSAKPNPRLLVLDQTPLEETLQSICFSLHSLHQQNIKYGLKLRNTVMIAPANTPQHLENCLRELARYEA